MRLAELALIPTAIDQLHAIPVSMAIHANLGIGIGALIQRNSSQLPERPLVLSPLDPVRARDRVFSWLPAELIAATSCGSSPDDRNGLRFSINPD
jgi:hypothetical protein